MRPIDITGQSFNCWTVVRLVKAQGKRRMWEFRCVCGSMQTHRATAVVSGATKSCGCQGSSGRLTHGMKGEPEYIAWQSMKSRCNLPTYQTYHLYGGRGISVCDRWEHSFENFFADMGHRPSKGHSLERINNDGNYEPSNCKWATRSEQSRNRRTCRFFSAFGRTMILKDWAKLLGYVNSSALSRQIEKHTLEVVAMRRGAA
jgi:hypothetical protein